MEREIGNKLIAEFMNVIYYQDEAITGRIVCYHSSWDWLMPVVEKIEGLGFQFFIHNDGSYIKKWFYRGNVPDIGNVGDCKIDSVVATAIEFIKWHNTTLLPSNKPSNNDLANS